MFTHPFTSIRRLLLIIHRDERGSLSITSMFGLVILTILLGLVINSNVQFDEKVRMQNAADAATYSGGVSLARSMNTVAFSNHLLWDTFALTAYMREARDQTAITLTPEMLANWERIGPALADSEFPKFAALGVAISEKAPAEVEMVESYSAWSQAASEIMLPVFEDILANERIPEFQRSIAEAAPIQAQLAAEETARRHAESWPSQVDLHAVIWRTNGDPAGGGSESEERTLPVLDSFEYTDREQAREFRSQFAHSYLHLWNNESLETFDEVGKMSQFGSIWRILDGGQLERLLEEYPDTNLMFMLRRPWEHGAERISQSTLNDMYDRDFMFVGVVYRDKRTEQMPRIFKSPAGGDTQAYAQVMLMVPKRRLLKYVPGQPTNPNGGGSRGGVPGQDLDLPAPPAPELPEEDEEDDGPDDEQEDEEIYAVRQNGHWFPEEFSMRNQNWSVQLTPATSQAIPLILSSQPYTNPALSQFQTPNLQSLEDNDLQWLSNH